MENQHSSHHAHDHAHHDHGDHHEHGLGHVHVGSGQLGRAFFLNVGIVVVQLIAGLMANSLALLSDAGHNATDVLAIVLAWFAVVQAKRSATRTMTYGYHRTGILVALVNAVSLILVALYVGVEAYERILDPQPVALGPVLFAAALGLVVNAYSALGLRGDHDVNIRSAFLHLLGDAAASASVILGAVIIYFTDWYWVDPLLSVVVSVLIAVSAWEVVRRTLRILMEAAPERVDVEAVVHMISNTPGVKAVHDLHVWSLAADQTALSCHVVVDGDRSMDELQPLQAALAQRFKDDFGIGHSTIQLESAEHGHDAAGCGAPL